MKSPPIRLLDDPETPEALRRDLRRAATTAPVLFDVAGAAAPFEARIRAASAGKSVALAKWAATAFIVGAAGGVVLLRSSSSPGPAPVEAPSKPSAALVPPAAMTSSPLDAGNEDGAVTIRVEDLPRAPPPPAETSASAPASIAPSASQAVPLSASMLREETENLAELRRVAERDPASAVALADDGHRRFAGGLLYQEREAIAIRSLAELGLRDEARARARRLLASYPNAPAAERLRRDLELP